jgi:hypothetical protein
LDYQAVEVHCEFFVVIPKCGILLKRVKTSPAKIDQAQVA